MSDEFFYKQMINMMGAPLYLYDADGRLCERTGSDDKEWWSWLGYDSEQAKDILLKRKDYPVIYTGGDDYVAAVLYDAGGGRILAAGPVMVNPYPDRQEKTGAKKYGRRKEAPACCPLDVFISGCLLLFHRMTGREMDVSELWEHNKDKYEKISLIQKKISEDMFFRQENYGKHNPYEQELRELESIEKGDVEALQESISETYEGAIGILAKDPLRHYKNVAIGNITLASRAAIVGGLSVENSFSMADSMIQQVEEIKNVPEVEMFKRECQFTYTAAVREEKNRRGGQSAEKNPLVGKVKDYIFNHLHSKIKVADIAESLNVNPNYLSDLFSKSEHMSIKKYMLQEKIRRSQNLLKYSDYHIQEIGFYLGFSSQSHFTRMFQEITGMNPNEYRRKYGNREKWK